MRRSKDIERCAPGWRVPGSGRCRWWNPATQYWRWGWTCLSSLCSSCSSSSSCDSDEGFGHLGLTVKCCWNLARLLLVLLLLLLLLLLHHLFAFSSFLLLRCGGNELVLFVEMRHRVLCCVAYNLDVAGQPSLEEERKVKRRRNEERGEGKNLKTFGFRPKKKNCGFLRSEESSVPVKEGYPKYEKLGDDFGCIRCRPVWIWFDTSVSYLYSKAHVWQPKFNWIFIPLSIKRRIIHHPNNPSTMDNGIFMPPLVSINIFGRRDIHRTLDFTILVDVVKCALKVKVSCFVFFFFRFYPSFFLSFHFNFYLRFRYENQIQSSSYHNVPHIASKHSIWKLSQLYHVVHYYDTTHIILHSCHTMRCVTSVALRLMGPTHKTHMMEGYLILSCQHLNIA